MLDAIVRKESKRIDGSSKVKKKELLYLQDIANQYEGVLKKEFQDIGSLEVQKTVLNTLRRELESVSTYSSSWDLKFLRENPNNYKPLARTLGWIEIKPFATFHVIKSTDEGVRLLNGYRRISRRMSVEEERLVRSHRLTAWIYTGETLEKSNEELLRYIKKNGSPVLERSHSD